MKRIVFRAQARVEFDSAGAWYERERRGLGLEFLNEMEAVLAQIAVSPLSFPVVHRDVRKAVVRRFPYCVFYRIRSDRIVVLAIFHTSRNPRQLQSRS